MLLSRNLPYGYIYNITHIMLTTYHTRKLVSIKDYLEGKVIFTNNDDIYNYLIMVAMIMLGIILSDS